MHSVYCSSNLTHIHVIQNNTWLPRPCDHYSCLLWIKVDCTVYVNVGFNLLPAFVTSSHTSSRHCRFSPNSHSSNHLLQTTRYSAKILVRRTCSCLRFHPWSSYAAVAAAVTPPLLLLLYLTIKLTLIYQIITVDRKVYRCSPPHHHPWWIVLPMTHHNNNNIHSIIVIIRITLVVITKQIMVTAMVVVNTHTRHGRVRTTQTCPLVQRRVWVHPEFCKMCVYLVTHCTTMNATLFCVPVRFAFDPSPLAG